LVVLRLMHEEALLALSLLDEARRDHDPVVRARAAEAIRVAYEAAEPPKVGCGS
jgi:hypothetical protein